MFLTRYNYMPVFQRLPQHFQRGTFVFGHFIKEENTIMRQTYFSGARVVAASYKCHIGYCMVG
jgi:hypothetical protein